MIDRQEAISQLQRQGYALVDGASVQRWLGSSLAGQDELLASWSRLPPDRYLKDQGKYRFRRHASVQVRPQEGVVQLMPHRPHWQPTTYNALHGGIRRWFEPLEPQQWQHSAMQALLLELAQVFAAAEATAVPQWFVEVHPFRIDASREVGKPTPEGAHRDGVDFVAVVLLQRQGVQGGETTVCTAQGEVLLRTTLTAPWTALLMDDRRVMHETTPIVGGGPSAHRDTLVLTYRAAGFMEPELEPGPSPNLSPNPLQ